MANTLNATTPAGSTAGTATGQPTTSAVKTDASKDMFLKLLVAQLKNQNPLNPTDGVDFLMQLSQISGVEQMVDMRQQLIDIKTILQGGASGTKPAEGTAPTSN